MPKCGDKLKKEKRLPLLPAAGADENTAEMGRSAAWRLAARKLLSTLNKNAAENFCSDMSLSPSLSESSLGTLLQDSHSHKYLLASPT